MSIVLTSEGDMIDELLWRHQGSEAGVVAALDLNRGLAAQGPVLPAGLHVVLPEATPPRRTAQVRLWGRT